MRDASVATRGRNGIRKYGVAPSLNPADAGPRPARTIYRMRREIQHNLRK